MINKKGTDMSEIIMFVGAVIITAIIGFALIFFVNLMTKSNSQNFDADMSISESSYTTRILLNVDVKKGYKFYEYILDEVNAKEPDGYKGYKKTLEAILKKFYQGEIKDPWVLKINGKIKAAVGPKTNEDFFINEFPPLIIPNPRGKNIEVLIKPIRPIDFKGVTRLKYIPSNNEGQVYSSSGIKISDEEFNSNKEELLYTPLGVRLAKIKDIPNVVCDEDDTSVGKICRADVEIIKLLKKMSKVLEERKEKIVITQAFRTWDIQNRLWIKNGMDTSKACNPGSYENPNMGCTHMSGRAIDVALYTEDNKKASPQELESLMCEFGFIRYAREKWHFEYGTDRYRRGHSANTCSII